MRKIKKQIDSRKRIDESKNIQIKLKIQTINWLNDGDIKLEKLVNVSRDRIIK